MINLVDIRFGRLVVVEMVNNNKCGDLRWLCQCDCGQRSVVCGRNLKSGNTQSCGCLREESRIRHGHSSRLKQSGTYESWHQMIQRCNNPKNKRYPTYGGRGIRVSEHWKLFVNFLEDMGERPPNRSIDRIDNDKGYFKENCRWATPKQQQRNRSNNHLITYDGKTQTMAAWAEEMVIPYDTLRFRLKRGWSIEKALKYRFCRLGDI